MPADQCISTQVRAVVNAQFCIKFAVLNGFVQLWNEICAAKMSILCHQKRDFSSKGRTSRRNGRWAVSAVLKIRCKKLPGPRYKPVIFVFALIFFGVIAKFLEFLDWRILVENVWNRIVGIVCRMVGKVGVCRFFIFDVSIGRPLHSGDDERLAFLPLIQFRERQDVLLESLVDGPVRRQQEATLTLSNCRTRNTQIQTESYQQINIIGWSN